MTVGAQSQSQSQGYRSKTHTAYKPQETVFALYLFYYTSKLLLIQQCLYAAGVSFYLVRRYSICLLLSFPYITSDRLSCAPCSTLPLLVIILYSTVQSVSLTDRQTLCPLFNLLWVSHTLKPQNRYLCCLISKHYSLNGSIITSHFICVRIYE